MGKLDVSGVPECQSCAACCFSLAEDYLRISGNDYERLGDAAEQLVQFMGNRAYLRMVEGHCVALEPAGESGFRCSIYERRPDVCRALERGSGHCAAERFEKAERPLVMLRTRR